MGEGRIGRREFIAGAALAAGAAATGAEAAHHEHTHRQNPYAALADAAQACTAAGAECRSHCLHEFQAGRTTLAACAARVEEMMAACEALVRLAHQGSAHVPAMAVVAAEICRDCERECRKHASTHPTCERCAEACAACHRACQEVAA